MARTHGIIGTYVSGCRCDACLVAGRAYQRARVTVSTAVPHGQLARYINSRCRCDLCKKASSDYQRARREVFRAQLRDAGSSPHVVEGITHGLSGYNHFCCRCEVCVEASREHSRARRRVGA